MIGGFSDEALLSAFIEGLESAGIGCTVVIADEGRLDISYANRAYAEILAVPREQAKRGTPFDVLPADEQKKLAELMAAVRRGEAEPPKTRATRIVRPDGSEVPVEMGFGYTLIADRRATFCFFRDVTERQRLQAELLKQDRLASLGVLAAGVAHELNNPLTALSLLVHRLRNAARGDVPSKNLASDLEQADEAVRRMSAIIGDLLFLARPADQPHAHVDVTKVVASSVALLRAGDEGCPKIIVDVGPLPPVQGFPSKLGQAVVNVVRNAMHACAERGSEGEVRVSARATDGEVHIVVEDNGAGIDADVLPRLATPFYTTKEGGTGLGLWITPGIVQAHGGRLELASTPGTGTRDNLVLPS